MMRVWVKGVELELVSTLGMNCALCHTIVAVRSSQSSELGAVLELSLAARVQILAWICTAVSNFIPVPFCLCLPFPSNHASIHEQ